MVLMGYVLLAVVFSWGDTDVQSSIFYTIFFGGLAVAVWFMGGKQFCLEVRDVLLERDDVRVEEPTNMDDLEREEEHLKMLVEEKEKEQAEHKSAIDDEEPYESTPTHKYSPYDGNVLLLDPEREYKPCIELGGKVESGTILFFIDRGHEYYMTHAYRDAVVEEILVSNGEKVTKGQLLVRLSEVEKPKKTQVTQKSETLDDKRKKLQDLQKEIDEETDFMDSPIV